MLAPHFGNPDLCAVVLVKTFPLTFYTVLRPFRETEAQILKKAHFGSQMQLSPNLLDYSEPWFLHVKIGSCFMAPVKMNGISSKKGGDTNRGDNRPGLGPASA